MSGVTQLIRAVCWIPTQEGQERKPFLSMYEIIGFDKRQPWLPDLICPHNLCWSFGFQRPYGSQTGCW